MLTAIPVPDTDVLEVTVDGAITADAMKSIRETLSVFIEAHEHPSILVVYGELGEIPPSAMLEDLKNTGLIKGLSRAAIVAHQRWLRTLTDLAKPFVPVEVRTFDEGDRDAALAWLTSPAG
jgi:hypothetical protein